MLSSMGGLAVFCCFPIAEASTNTFRFIVIGDLAIFFGRSSLQLLWASTISTQRELRDRHPQTPPIQQGSIAREVNLNNTMAASASAPVSIGPVVVVGSQFCAPYAVPLTITKKALSLSDSDFAVTDANGNVVLKVQGVFLSVRERCVLVDAAGAPLLTMQQKMFSMHGRWQVFRGDSTDAKDLVFTVKKSSVFQLKTQLDVIMAGNPNQEACDFKIKGSYFERSCTICVGNSGSIIAQMSRKYTVKNVLLGKDTFGVTVSPNVDYAFVAALIVVLDEINKSESGDA